MSMEKQVLIEENIREIIRKEGYCDIREYMERLRSSPDEYNYAHGVINRMMWEGYKQGQGQHKPEVILAYTDKERGGNLCFRFRTKKDVFVLGREKILR